MGHALDDRHFRWKIQGLIECLYTEWVNSRGPKAPLEFIPSRKGHMNEDKAWEGMDPVSPEMQKAGVSVAALFQAPAEPEGTAAAQHADPMNAQDEVERELSRLRNSRVDDIMREYLGTRDHLDEKRHEYQGIERDLKARLTMMSLVMREKADAIGVDSFPIRGLGTAYRATKTSIRVADWESYWKWLQETGNSQCVEKRAAKLAVLEVTRATGKLPPGLDRIDEVEFLVRRNDA